MDNESLFTGQPGIATWTFALTFMQQRIAAILALLAFALCLLVGAASGNSFTTILLRALLAMAGTYVLGSMLGWIAQRMLEENLKFEEEKLKNFRTETNAKDR